MSSLLKPEIISQAGHMARSAAAATEQRKLETNSAILQMDMCANSGRVLQSMGTNLFSKLASRLSIQSRCTKSFALSTMYGNLNLALINVNDTVMCL